jgi:hypothetical protein
LVRPFSIRGTTPLPKADHRAGEPVNPAGVSFGEDGSTVFLYRLFVIIEFQTIDFQTKKELGRDPR